MKRPLALFALSLVACVALPAAAASQSLFSTRGLGIPLEGADARARALGVNGVGLLGLSTSLLNPAEQAGTVRRGVSATFQPWGGLARVNGEEDHIGGTRFPLFQIMYPIGRTTFTLGYSGLLDQSWSIVGEGQQVVGNQTVATHDLVRSMGGINELKLGSAYYINTHLSIGGAIGVHSGNVERTITRSFPDSGSTLLGFTDRSRWNYSGPLASVGVRFDPARQVRLGASLTWSGQLDANPKEGSTTSYSYDMPLRLSAGASGTVSNRLLFAASATLSSFGSGSYAAPGLAGNVIAETGIDVGGGLEWQELRRGDRIFPLRAGFRYSKLPFHNTDESAPKEWAASGGIGLRLVEDDFGPLAVADIGFEKGKREGWTSTLLSEGLTENFWRFSATISLFGR